MLESIKKIRNANKCNTALVEFIEYYFPELAESEDEKIRKEIINCVKNYGPATANPKLYKDMLFWLEKQKEKLDLLEVFRKSVPEDWDFSKDLDLKEEVDRCFCNGMFPKYITPDTKITVSDLMRCASHFYKFGKEHKPVEWSEEDEKMLADIDYCIESLPLFYESLEVNGESKMSNDFIDKARNWLKSLTPQSHWKPTKEQLDALHAIIVSGMIDYPWPVDCLRTLYNELEKLSPTDVKYD